MSKLDLSIIIPANNAEKLNKTLAKYALFFCTQKRLTTEILVVANSYLKGIAPLVSKYSQKYSNISFIQTPYQTGKGGAVSLGFLQAKGSIVGYVDSDGSIAPQEIVRLFNLIHETPFLDGVVGNRDLSIISQKREFYIRSFSFLSKLFFGLGYKDTQCGIKLFKNSCAKDLAKRLSNTGYAFDVNLLLVARYLNFNIKEVGIKWSEKMSNDLYLFNRSGAVLKEFIGLKALELGNYVKSKADILMDAVSKPVTPKRNKTNILIMAWRDLKHPQVGGSEVYVHQIAKRLAKENNVTLLTSRPKNMSKEDVVDGVRIIRRGGFLGVYLFSALTYLFELRKNTDVIIDVENGIPFFTPLYSRKPRILVVHHVHGNQYFKQFSYPVALIGFFIERVLMPFVYKNTTVVTVSPSSLNELINLGFDQKKVYLSYNAVPAKKLGKISKSKTPILVYLGRIKAYKRIDFAIQTFKSLLNKYPKMKMLIGGAGDFEEALKAQIKSLKLEDKVEMLGFVSERQKWEILKKAWVFLMPSMKEGWGITISEAAYCKTPSVGFDVPGVRDSIRNNSTGFLANSEKDYINLVDILLKEKSLRESFGEEGQNYAKNFSWDNSASVFGNLIENATSLPSQKFLANKSYPWLLKFGFYLV